jgi:hypothetical protein
VTAALILDALTLEQLVAEVGLPPRRIDYWARAGVFGPAKIDVGSGNRRLFDPLDVLTARAVAELARLLPVLPVELAASAGLAIRLCVRRGRWLVITPDGPYLDDVVPSEPVAVVVDLEQMGKR